MLLLTLPLAAAEIEGTAWYDAEGELVVVEGPNAEKAKRPFVAESQRRDWERRERMSRRGSWSASEYDWPVWGTSYPVRRSDCRGYGLRGAYRRGAFRFGGFCRPAFRGGSTLVIRW